VPTAESIDAIVAQQIHVRPLNDCIIVLPLKDESEVRQTASGLFIETRLSAGGVDLPDTVDAEPIEGRIVALGRGLRYELPYWLAERLAREVLKASCMDADPNQKTWADHFAKIAAEPKPFDVKVGDRVLWTPWAAFTITIDEVSYFIIEEADIVGVISEA
jgi:co-chaperonin GroES (HSP10)